MSREGNLLKNTIILSIGTFFPKLVSVVTLPILTGYLSKSEFGSYDLITTMVSLFLPIITLQIQSAAFRFLIEKRDDREAVDSIVTNILMFTAPISVAALIILYLFMPGVSAVGRVLICIYYFFDIIYVALQQVTRGLSYNLTYSISAIILSSTNLILTVLLVWKLSNGLNGVLIAMAVSYAFGCIFLAYKIRDKWTFKPSLFSFKDIKRMLAYSWPMVFNNLSSWVLRLSDRLVITAFLGITANAVYAVACKIPNLLSMVQSTFTMAWQENATIASQDDDASSYYESMYDNMYGIISGFTALLIAATPILFFLLIRGDYDDAYVQMPLLFLGMMFCCLSAFQGGIYVAYMRTKEVGITTVISAVINLLIDLLLVKVIGITAGSISTLISYLALTIYRMYDVNKFVKIKYNYPKILLVLAVLIVMCVLCSFNVLWINIVNFVVGCTLAFVINKNIIFNAKNIILKKLKK